MEEYHDGILLFELTDQKVWSRAVKDSAGLVDFHGRNLDQFMWPQRLDAGIHTCEDVKIAKKVRKALRKTGDVEGLRRELIAERPLALRNEFGKYVEGDNAFADRAFAALHDGLWSPKNGLVILKPPKVETKSSSSTSRKTWRPHPNRSTSAVGSHCRVPGPPREGVDHGTRGSIATKSTARLCTAWCANDFSPHGRTPVAPQRAGSQVTVCSPWRRGLATTWPRLTAKS